MTSRTSTTLTVKGKSEVADQVGEMMKLAEGLFSRRHFTALPGGLQQRHKHGKADTVDEAYHNAKHQVNNKLVSDDTVIKLEIA